ncbi:MAG: hypothetical protein ACPGCR_03965, partial [Acholeplasmataceae bacterium]
MVIIRQLKQRQPFLFSGIIMFLFIFIPTVLSLSKILESSDKWAFIVEQLLEAYITQTFILICSVVVLTLALGVFSAYII